MPRLPQGMFRRQAVYYVRIRRDYRDRWVSLGRDFAEALRRYRDVTRPEAPAGRTPVHEAASRWLATYVRNARNPKGLRITERRVELYLREFFRHRDLGAVTGDDLRRYRIYLEKRGLAPQTVFHLLADAGCFFRWCVDTGLLLRSPVPRKLMPKIQERPPRRVSEESVAVLVQLPDPYGFTVRLALGSGLRWGELIRARREDVQDGVLLVHQTKSGKVRRVPLPPALRVEVEERSGRLVPFEPPTAHHFTRVARRLTGLRDFHVHQLRHTFACRWLERGGSLAALQQLLGHASVVTTQRYARLSDDHVQSEVRRLWPDAVADSVAGRRQNLPAAIRTTSDYIG